MALDRLQIHRDTIITQVLFVIGALWFLLPASPLLRPYIARDSGVFLYVAQQLLEQQIPYRDVWDHKPPIIFFINTIGVALTPQSAWGIWWVEVVFLLAVLNCAYRALRTVFGALAARLGLLWMLGTLPAVLDGGNLTTEYSLLWQWGALWCVCTSPKIFLAKWRWYALGVLAGLTFFTKQNTIAISLSMMLIYIILRLQARQYRGLRDDVAWFSAGGLTVTLLIVLFFATQGALSAFWDAAFAYNFVYAGTTWNSRVEAVLQGLNTLWPTGLALVALMGYIGGVFAVFSPHHTSGVRVLIGIGLIALPLELVLVSTSGRTYSHYFMVLLPVFAIFAAWMIYLMQRRLQTRLRSATRRLLFLLMGVLILTVSLTTYQRAVYHVQQQQPPPVLEYLRDNATPDQPILIWGAETSIHYVTGLSAPSRFVYQYPLHTPGYTTAAMIAEFLEDVMENSPQFILVPPTWGEPFVFDITDTQLNLQAIALQKQYTLVASLEDWLIYAKIPAPV